MAKQQINSTQKSNLHAFRVYISTTYTPAAGVNIINWDAKSYDLSNNFNLTTDQYTIPITGYYTLFARLSVNANTRAFISIYKNSAELSRGSDMTVTAPAASNVFDRVFLTAGDLIDCRFYCATAGAFENDATRSYFGMSLDAS